MAKRTYKKQTIDTSQATLVVVESPAKAKTIKKYLWPWYEVTASMGHIVDLAKWNDAIDKAHGFEPSYVVSPDKKSIVASLKKASKSMKIRLATDEDREWEAIARHLCQQLWLPVSETPRIVFREITKEAITNAIKHPRRVDEDLVDAQQARRVLDRLVWFELSPVLWKKVKAWLSAWRVQSVAVKLLVEKEREVIAHTSKSSFKIEGEFQTDNGDTISAKYSSELPEFDDFAHVEPLFTSLAKDEFTIQAVDQKPWAKKPAWPLTTSTLQQTASSKLGFSVSRTMQLAQRLYEAWHITYMRTDSFALSKQALGMIFGQIEKLYGNDYKHPRSYWKKAKWAQEAHEAIRPTSMGVMSAWADEAQQKLYRLIRQRTMGSQMADAKTLKTDIVIKPSATDGQFTAKWEVITFPWFMALYTKEDAHDDGILPSVKVWETVKRWKIIAQESFSKPPARYSEASLVKKLEQLGIGRPSTYAPTISTIQKRWYVEPWQSPWTPTDHRVVTLSKVWKLTNKTVSKNIFWTKGRLVPTPVGMVVTDFLDEHFPEVMDYSFTASVEKEFDTIAEWKLKRQEMIKKFYVPFHTTVEKVEENADRASGERVLGEDPKTWKPLLVRIGRYGPLVQIGSQDDEEKQFASLPPWYQLETVTLEQALEAFDLPRELGELDGKKVKANIGRFGPYVQHWSTFASLKLPDDPYDIEYERAVELIEEKRARDIANTLRVMEIDDKTITIKKWRRGPFFMRWRKRIGLKGQDINTLTVEDIRALTGAKPKTKPKKKKPSAKKKSL